MSRFEGTSRASWEPHVSGLEAEKERSSEMGARKEGCGESSGGVGGEGQMCSREGSAAPDGLYGVVGRHKDTRLRAAEALEQYLEPGT